MQSCRTVDMDNWNLEASKSPKTHLLVDAGTDMAAQNNLVLTDCYVRFGKAQSD